MLQTCAGTCPIASDGGEPTLSGKKIHIPPMAYGSAQAFAAAFRAVGLDAEPTPPSDHRTRELGARYTSGDECYPAKVTVGDFMKVLEPGIGKGADPARTVFFMPTAQGPCRFGQYSPYLRHVLNANGYSDTEVLAPSSNNGYGGLGEMAGPFMRTGWRALLAADILQKLLLQYRPHELETGRAERVYESCLADVCRTVETTPVKPTVQLAAIRAALLRARDRFRAIPGRRDRSTPLIGIVGEIFLPAQHLFERKPDPPVGRIPRGSLALGHRRMGLVHQLGALPQTEAQRPLVDVGSAGSLGAQPRAEARRARAAGAFPR